MDLTYNMAESAEERIEVQDFLAQHIGFEIAPNAVPLKEHDSIFDPVIVIARGDAEMVGAALSCRAQVCTSAAMFNYCAPYGNFSKAKDRHSELDIMAVSPAARDQGIGTQILTLVEHELLRRGVRFWFGNITSESNVPALVQFYERNGFAVLPAGEGLPPFMGLPWRMPHVAAPEHYFWKRLRTS